MRHLSKERWLSPAPSEAKCQAVPLVILALRMDLQGKRIQKISNPLLPSDGFTGFFLMLL